MERLHFKDFKDTIDSSSVSHNETVRILAYLLHDKCKKVYGKYNANDMCTNAHVYRGLGQSSSTP